MIVDNVTYHTKGKLASKAGQRQPLEEVGDAKCAHRTRHKERHDDDRDDRILVIHHIGTVGEEGGTG